ncbi:MAG: methyltransferase family protein [Thermoleophilaceae bacterium]
MAAIYVVLGLWIAGELWLQRRTGSSADRLRDPTYFVMSLCTFGAVFAGIAVERNLEDAKIAADRTVPLLIGLVMVAFGVGLRAWAVVTLGRWFTYSVQVEEGQTVVETGPYRRLRHPSYTGMVIGIAGIGVALDNWLALAIAVVVPVAGVAIRIRVEETLLFRELGDAYRSYAARTWRLVPGVW